MFGSPVPPGDLLAWDWAEQRLITARNYWIATTRPDGRPHCRPVWGVWLAGGLWFSTGSLAGRNLARNERISMNLEGGDEVVIVEGAARPVAAHAALAAMCEAYSPKYDYPITPATDGTVRDTAGTGGPVWQVVPHVVFGWAQDMSAPTRWTFPQPTTGGD